MKKIIKFTNEKPEKISNFLNQEFELPIVLTSKLMNSRIGEVIIKRIAKIIYPFKVPNPNVSVPAIKAGIINGLAKGKGKINILSFLQSYPNKIITINIPALSKVITKVETVNDLVKFFSASPLKSLKEGQHKDLD